MTFDKILALAKKYSYFSKLPSKSKSKVYNLQLENFGVLFQNNIKSLWLSSNISKKFENTQIFDHTKNTYNENVFYDSFVTTSNFHKNKLPFEMIEFYKTNINKCTNLNGETSIKFSFPSYTVLSLSKFLSTHDSTQYFFNLQRKRKLWWKKISACPERFSIGETKSNSEKGESTMEIIAQFPWGKHIVETITSSDVKIKSDISNDYTNILPVRVNNEISLENALIILFCDSAELGSDNYMVTRLNKMISPYKCVFTVDSKSTIYKELLSFSMFLNEELEQNNIPSILPCDSIPVQKQFQRNDEWGVPFSIKIDENSVQTGIVGLRCRDTTLIEEVHVSELSSHIESILNAGRADVI